MRRARVRAIALREWRETVFNKSFLVVSLLVPGLMVGVSLLPGWIATRQGIEQMPDNAVRAGGPQLLALLLMIFLFLGVTSQSQALLRSVMEERSSRMVEVLLSSIEPLELLVGKIIGYAAVSMTQFMVWIGAGFALSAVLGMPPLLRLLGSAGPRMTLLFLSCYAVGYLIYASLYTLLASVVSAEREAYLYQQLFALVLVSPFVITIALVANPAGATARQLTWVPLFTPTMLLMRAALGEVPMPVIAGSLTTGALTSAVLLVIASRLFRGTTLLAVRRVPLRDVWNESQLRKRNANNESATAKGKM
ncbi:MAG: ABC transporter permease [Gemmatimonadaceae bacterium]